MPPITTLILELYVSFIINGNCDKFSFKKAILKSNDIYCFWKFLH